MKLLSANVSELAYGGKILFIDDQYDEAIDAAITKLIQKGMAVHYWNGRDDFPETIRNVRVVVLDLNLLGLGSRPTGPEFYYPAAEAIHKIPGPFLVVIMALDFNDKDPTNLREAYQTYYGTALPGFVSDEGLTKDEEKEDPNRLADLVARTVDKEKILDLILLWEGVVDGAKDVAMKDLVKEEIENTIIALIQSVCREFGEESAARQLVSMMMRLLSRSTTEAKEFSKLENLILELNKTELKGRLDRFLYHRLTFYHPKQEERVWTGDIYRTSNERKYDQYAIVLTPACDLSQSKTISVLACFAFPLDEEFLEDEGYPPYQVDHVILKKRARGANFGELREAVKQRFLERKDPLPARFYILRNFVDDDKKDPFCICFDFNNVRSVLMNDLGRWSRICRLDSPFIEDMLQKYGSQAFRIGTPDWR